MSAFTRESPAKINLTLRVGPLRPDGFHEIESLVARVGLYDTVSVQPQAERQLTLECNDPSVPCDDTNLALRAARLLADHTGTTDGARVSLRKRIPAGAGLGGGSSNAATVLMLLNELWQLRLQRDELAALGAQIGSDVPLFFHGPLCIVRGRGEQIAEVGWQVRAWVVLVLPQIRSPTPDVYAAWDALAARPQRLSIQDVLKHAQLAATDDDESPHVSAEVLMPLLFNDLEEAALAINPPLAKLVDRVGQLSDGPVRMTGSGSGLFRLFDSRSAAQRFAGNLHAALDTRVEAVPLGAD
jgi:4-diphosphocytidyl-2-C-methyl-D-erythritol kinase